MSSNLPARLLKPGAKYLARGQTTPLARVAFVLDATESRNPTWDLATSLTSQMFSEAWRLGGISISSLIGPAMSFTPPNGPSAQTS